MTTSQAPGREGHHNAATGRRCHALPDQRRGDRHPISDVPQHEAPARYTHQFHNVSTY